MIAIENLIKKYNSTVAVNIDELIIENGDIIGLVGNNGAGKTTLFRLILDLVKADGGIVNIKGRNVSNSEQWKDFTGAYLDEAFLISYLTPNEYFYFIGELYGFSKVIVDEFLERFELFFNYEIDNKKYIRELSKGNQFKVGIVASLLQRPELLILDEPFSNLDPSSQSRLINLLKDIHERDHITIVVSSHDLNNIADLCKRILVLEKGEIVKDIQATSDTIHELTNYFKV